MKQFLIRLLLFVIFLLLFIYAVKDPEQLSILKAFVCAWILEGLINHLIK